MNNNNTELLKLPNEPVRSALINIIEKNFNLNDYQLVIESGSSKGDNYIGVIYRAKITWSNQIIPSSSSSSSDIIITDDTKNIDIKSNHLNIMIKVPPESETRREQFFARPCFLREILAYNEILPMFIEFQKSKGLSPAENGFHEFAECYKTLDDDKFEGIFLKDLGMDGFTMHNRLDDITADHVKLVMHILGKYHAISFAMQDQCPDKLQNYTNLTEILLARENDPFLIQYFEELKKRSMKTLSAENDQLYIERIDQLFAGHDFFYILKSMLNGKSAEPYAILCHGDCWNNNILFKSINGKPMDARLIDWQILRYASPLCDIMYYIFSCTTKELRDQYYYDFINIYYTTLTEYIEKLGSNPQKLFPKSDFDEQLKKFGPFGLLMGMMLLPMFTSEAEDLPDLDDLSQQIQSGEMNVENVLELKSSTDVYKKRMRDIIVDMVNYGYI